MRCPNCSSENPDGQKFCGECATPLARSCPNCGAVANPTQKFCGECATPLTSGATPAPVPTQPTPVAERRVVSVLFADLVGFTPLSEAKDAETVRELLSGYFDVARTVIARYGGTVEKFIGDAVMAVWGVPTAQEHDAELCVRAGLELVDAVGTYGEANNVAGLRARAGVVTGEVAVTIGASGEGMVAGDAVNTAARVQAAAEPGTVLVDDTTKAATTKAINYADAGEHELKGKAEAARLWRATRVVGSVGGTERVDGLEASFLGRDRELRQVKDLFHACIEGRKARLVSVVGPAGVGKSRLRWEFEKYIDGLADLVLWHTGRCLSYGDGVAYWALAEMVRQRLGIAEEESPESAAAKLADGLQRWITDPADREFLAPRLGVLIGVAEPGLGREDLFAGWRMFFERLTDQNPVVLCFEDLQWADSGLLDFIEQLLDWSAEYPILVITFARPELTDRRSTWAAARRNAMPLSLEPLPETVMRGLLEELVPGLPADVADAIVAQADGIPLYAVETVRSLVDRDLVQPIDGIYRLVGKVDALDVPASLASLIAARIDALSPAERSLVQDLAVLGTTFPRTAAAAVSRLPEEELDGYLADLVRREILAVRSDRLSPDKGQYTFTQSLVRQVAYDTLSRRDRKSRHLAVAAHLRATFADDGADVAEVVAQHYRDALEAVPDDADADAIRTEAVSAYMRAGERALVVGAPETAEKAYRVSRELAVSEEQRLELTERTGEAAMRAGNHEVANDLFRTLTEAYTEAGRTLDAARMTAQRAKALSRLSRQEEAVPLLQAALESVSDYEPDETLAQLHSALAGSLLFIGRRDEAKEHIETALALAQALQLRDVLAEAAGRKAIVLSYENRVEEALVLFEWQVRLAEQLDNSDQAEIGHANAGDLSLNMDLRGAVEHCEAALSIVRRLGDRYGESIDSGNLALCYAYTGRWDEAMSLCEQALAELPDRPGAGFIHNRLANLSALRGDVERARAELAHLDSWSRIDEVQLRGMHATVSGGVALVAGNYREALEMCSSALLQTVDIIGFAHEVTRQAWPDALEAAMRVPDLEAADDLLHTVADRPIGHVPPYLRGQLARYRARLAAARGQHTTVHADFQQAAEILRGLRYPYWLACTQTDHAEWLISQQRDEESRPLLEEAQATFARLGAAPALTRAQQLLAQSSVAVTL